ncbi:LPO_1073/Vpar_1526 family protein [Streptomyces sp. HUAS ZL42]|uniref:LPO_1073/Vpar_1526 family protein n=1 Tax=Streptomyces sp. HUAS ZL42 TaxID=3231715 RepID=UPI00345E405C
MKQIQRAGDNSTNFQAEVIHAGISYRDARDIATDVYKENIPKFAEIAREVALERAEIFNEKLLDGIAPETLEALKDPDVQRSLFFAQQEYACSGEEDLRDVLIELLRKRMTSPVRDIRQLSITESLKTAPKLSAAHLSALSALLILIRTRLGVANVEDLRKKLREILAPVVTDLHLSNADVAYMEYAGCLSIQITEHSIGSVLLETYKGCFTRGFTVEQIPEDARSGIRSLLMPCLRDPAKLQIASLNQDMVAELIKERGLEEYAQQITALLDVGIMNVSEIAEEFAGLHPALENLVNIFHSTSLKSCQLTTVGTTLAHTNLRRMVGEAFEPRLDVWVH